MILCPSAPYTVHIQITNPGAVTNLVVHAHATRPLLIIRARINLVQAALPTAAGARIRLGRKTAAGTYTSVPASGFVNLGNDADAGFTAGHTASAEGTDGDVWEEPIGSQTGWSMNWEPTPEGYLLVPAGVANGFMIKSNVALPAGVYAFQIDAHEIGG